MIVVGSRSGSAHFTVLSVHLTWAISTATHGVLLQFLQAWHLVFLLVQEAILLIPLDGHPRESVRPVLVLTLMDKSTLMRSGPSLILLWLVPVLNAIAVVRLLVEPFEAFDLLGLPLQYFSFVIELPQLFIFQELKLFLRKFLHLFDALRIAIQRFKVLLDSLKKLLFLLLFVDIWVSLWLIFLNNFPSDLFTQLLLY